MITDEIKITVLAGKGGDGIATFSKVKMVLGPTGGRGGNGGNVLVKGVSNLTALNKYRHKKEFWAEDGERGKGAMKNGHNGKDLILTVPIGSVVRNLDAGNEWEIIETGQTVQIAKGGLGGRGNFSFKSSTNTSPEKWEEGKPGEKFDFLIELRLIADAGLIGLPNAGKSSLLNELTKADVRVADYPFTTLEPNLGAIGKIILADIPGLIEGASAGKGLGVKFLRHIQRTKVLFHCISLESDDIERDYKIIRKELEKYSPELTLKKEIVLLTKADVEAPEKLEQKIEEARRLNPQVFSVSIHDWDSLERLKKTILSAVSGTSN